jgi:hypothetical protein
MIGRGRVLVAALLAVLALLAVAVVARSSPSHPFVETTGRIEQPTAPPRSLPTLAVPTAPVNPTPAQQQGKGGGSQWLAWSLLAIGLATFVMIASRTTWRLRIPRLERAPERAEEELPDEQAQDAAAPEELTAAVEEGLDTLRHGPVSDAIIACWVRVEDAASEAGTRIRPSETSAEFVDRVLGTYGAGPEALRQMAAMYREARFSTHTLDEDSRARARRCLRTILDDLARPHAQP